jgi:hypothetical protein
MTNSSEIANEVRAARAGCILIHNRHGQDLHTSLVDFLADAMHWCDCSGEDFHLVLAQACRHYIHELNDQQEDERRLIA